MGLECVMKVDGKGSPCGEIGASGASLDAMGCMGAEAPFLVRRAGGVAEDRRVVCCLCMATKEPATSLPQGSTACGRERDWRENRQGNGAFAPSALPLSYTAIARRGWSRTNDHSFYRRRNPGLTAPKDEARRTLTRELRLRTAPRARRDLNPLPRACDPCSTG